MATSIENLRRVAGLGIEAHKIIVDAFIALGYDLDKIAIIKGYYQPDAKDILAGYGFTEKDCGRFAKLPQSLVNEYVDTYFPGLDEANPQGNYITLDMYLDAYHRDWRNMTDEPPRVFMSMRLTKEEQEMMKREEQAKDE